MIESFYCGVVVSLAFIGLISIVYFALIHILNPDKSCLLVVYVDETYTTDNACNFVCFLSILSLFFDNLFSDILFVYDVETDLCKIDEIKNVTKDHRNLLWLEQNKLLDYIQGKVKDGTGVY